MLKKILKFGAPFLKNFLVMPQALFIAKIGKTQ